jgi:hypothetical protein
MSQFLLNEDLIMCACHFQGTMSGEIKSSYSEAVRDKLIEKFHNSLVRDLIIKQPGLSEIYDNFVKRLKIGGVFPSSLFAEMFADKIDIENFKDQLLTKDFCFKDKLKRKNALTFLLEKYPPFILMVHDFISDKRKANYNFSEDPLLYEFYLNSLKAKNPIKDNLPSDEILSNIDAFNSIYEPSINKKKLNAYIVHFPNDIVLYNHIMENMGSLITNDGVFKKLWEDKTITLFPNDVQELYRNKNVQIKMWDEEFSYHYKFQINLEYIIENSQIATSKAERFHRVFHNTLGNLINSKFNPLGETRTGLPSISFLFSSDDDRQRVRTFCHSVKENILFLIKSFNFDADYMVQSNSMEEYLKKMHMAFTLTEDLNSAPSKVNKVRKL